MAPPRSSTSRLRKPTNLNGRPNAAKNRILEEKVAMKECDKQPNAWYNNNFLIFGILVAIVMVCGTVYSVANNLSATMEKENGPELKHPEVQEPQAKIDENPSGWALNFDGILIGLLIIYLILLPIVIKKGLDNVRRDVQNLDQLVCQQIQKLWRVLDKIRGPKQLDNPKGNRFKDSNPNVTISPDGLKVENTEDTRQHVYAEKGFDISGASRKEDNFTGTIIYYFEVKQTSPGQFRIGLSDEPIPDGKRVGECPNSYGLPNSNYCWISGKKHAFEWPEGVTKPERDEDEPSTGDVDGCGLLLSPDKKLTIFFTFDGILIGKPIPIKISPSVHCLYPTVTMWEGVSLEANFGDNPDKPFSCDIAKWPQCYDKTYKEQDNANANRWKDSNPNVTISGNGLKVGKGNTNGTRENVYAKKGFDISANSREQNKLIYYFEVKQTSPGRFFIGLSDGSIPDGDDVGDCPNSFGRFCTNSDYCWIAGKKHAFEWPQGVTKPECHEPKFGDIYGCGLLLSPNNKLAIFFTFNGNLLGKPIPITISSSVHHLYPTVTMCSGMLSILLSLSRPSLEANFGDNPAKPFTFDSAKCPQLVFP